jgi:hypothetical protein
VIGRRTDAKERLPLETLATMFHSSYAVLWREGDGPVRVGKLILGPTGLRLETGTGRDRASSKVLRYSELTGIGTALPADRIRARPTAVVDRSGRERLRMAAVDGLGSVLEIVERIADHLTPVART